MMELNILPQIADTLTSMNKTNAVTSINKILEKIPISRLYHKLKEPTSGSLDIAVTVCKREYVKPHFTPNEADIPNDEIYILTNENSGLKIKGTNAKMVIRDNKFVVLQGSGSLAVQVVDDKKDTNYGKLKYPSIAKKREEYIDSNLIEIIDEHHGFFITDVSFKSPSTAAEFTRGTTMNGWDNNWVREKKDGSKENLEARRKELDPGYARKLK
jgi:hypothetical protein